MDHIEEMYEALDESLVYLNEPQTDESKMIIVGDTHGQLNDVLWIFFKFGLPDNESVYVLIYNKINCYINLICFYAVTYLTEI